MDETGYCRLLPSRSPSRPLRGTRSADAAGAADAAVTILKPARVFDGETMHEGWAVRVNGERIEAAGPRDASTPPARR